MRQRSFTLLSNVTPWSGSLLIHAALSLAFLTEGARSPSVSSALPPGRLVARVPARIVPAPNPSPLKVKKRTAPLTHADGKVALPTQKTENLTVPEEAHGSMGEASQDGGEGGTAVLTLRERYLFGLRQRIEKHKTYPAMAKRLRESGRVVISLTLLPDGSIGDIAVISPSSFERLDRAALETVKAVKRYEPFPEGLSGDVIRVEIPIEYAL